MKIPYWLRYVALTLATFTLTSFAYHEGTSQFISLVMANSLATTGKAMAGSQKLLSEGKTKEAGKLLCVATSINWETVTGLTKIVEDGLFPIYAVEFAAGAEIRALQIAQQKHAEAEKRCASAKKENQTQEHGQ